jgi:putative ABC transport system substrate-binding protein
MNNRRKLLVALGASTLTSPFASFAQQQGKVWRVGYLSQVSRQASTDTGSYIEFLRGMRELGYAEGKNLVIEWRFADGKVERLPGLAIELVELKVDAIVSATTISTSALQKATTNIPIVMASDPDPVGAGFVKSMAHPGGNITGLSIAAVEISTKLLQLLLDIAPKRSRVAVLVNPANSSHTAILKSIQAAAQRTGVTILPMEARTASEIENAFADMAR